MTKIYIFFGGMNCSTKWLITIPIYILLMSAAFLLCISGVGYYYFTQDFLIIKPKFNLNILFGLGIGIGLIFFIGIWFFLTVPRFACNYILTFPAFFIMTSIFIAFSVPSSFDKYVSKWDEEWSNEDKFLDLQINHRCCGWNNYTDRSLTPCPLDYVSGCKNFITEFLEPRFSQIFALSISAVILCLISFISLLLACSIGGQDDLLAHFDSTPAPEEDP